MSNDIFLCHTCPMTRTMATLGTKWKPIIIYALGNVQPQRFGQLFAKMGIISKKVLTEQLKELEDDGIIKREAFKETPPRVEYTLTPKGLELLPIMNMLTQWNDRHHSDSAIRE